MKLAVYLLPCGIQDLERKLNPNTTGLKCSQNATTVGDAGNEWVVILPKRSGKGVFESSIQL